MGIQLLAQVMKLSYFPQIKVVHTSKIFHGQGTTFFSLCPGAILTIIVYIPLINWLLMIGTVLAAGIYNNVSFLNCH